MSTYDALKDLVLAGAITAGERTSEAQLAEALEVSRTPVREALQRLEGDGLVVAQGRGVRLRTMNTTEMADLLMARAGLEGWAAWLAADAVRAGLVAPTRLALLDQLADKADELSRTGDSAGGAEANRALHLELARLSESPATVQTLEGWWNRIVVTTRSTIDVASRVADVDLEHRALLEAVKAGLPAEARAAAEHHVLETRDALLNTHHRTLKDLP